MPSKKKPSHYRANETLFLPGRRVIVEGDILEANDKALKGREAKFTPVDYVGVEQATAAPGEVRNVTTRPKKAADDST